MRRSHENGGLHLLSLKSAPSLSNYYHLLVERKTDELSPAMEWNQCSAARRVLMIGVMKAMHRYRPPLFLPSADMLPIMGVGGIESQIRITAVWNDTHYGPDRQMFTRSFYARPGSPRHGRARVVKPQNKMCHHVPPLRLVKHAPPRLIKNYRRFAKNYIMG
jgi:hypothetical protein